jgi:hypothetical protein
LADLLCLAELLFSANFKRSSEMGVVRGQTAEHGDTTHWICDLLHSTHGLSRKYGPGSAESRLVPGSGNPNATDILFYIICKNFHFFLAIFND